jgi:hypothetical protein
MIQEYKIIINGHNLPDLSKDIALQLDCSFITDKPTKISNVSVELINNNVKKGGKS